MTVALVCSYTPVKYANEMNMTVEQNMTVDARYCDDLTMKFSFGVIVLSYALVGVILCCCCVGVCCMCIRKPTPS